MVNRGDITIYHKKLNSETRLEEYERYYYKNCWYNNTKSSSQNNGYSNTNSIVIRIPYNSNDNANVSDFSIGDIIYIGNGINELNRQTELQGNTYNITTIKDNNYGLNQHIHIIGV